ncbi:unnamed protein product [Linum trigynum]|uniref:Uncharacterized protein n=1 Tax=Linum trigynum TaxID=586398 RepID=A0AAV2EV13_9ROSI
MDALRKDVYGFNASAIATTSSYFYGKLVSRGARLALVAEEVGFPDVIPAVRRFLKETIEPWLEGTFNGKGVFVPFQMGWHCYQARANQFWRRFWVQYIQRPPFPLGARMLMALMDRVGVFRPP